MKLLKKIAIALMAASVIGGSAVGITACGGGSTPTSPPVNNDSGYSTNVTPSYSNTGVQDYLNRSDVQSQINILKSSMQESGTSLSVVAEGNSMVYIYRFNTMQYPSSSELANMRSQMQSQQSVYRTLINEIESLTSAVNPSVVARYINADGSTICELTFTKNGMTDTTPAGSYTPSGSTGSDYGTGSATQQFATLQAFLDANSAQLTSGISGVTDALYQETGIRLNMDVYAQGNILVYEMNTTTYPDVSFSSYMQNFLNSSDAKSVYGGICDQLEQYVSGGISVNIIVTDPSGNIVAQQVYY